LRRLALLTALCALAALTAATTASARTVVVVRGAGFGHGIGMSQYGAFGFARNGRDYRTILAHYYRGTRIGSAPSRPVRVLLRSSAGSVRIRGASRVANRTLRPSRTYTVVRSGSGLRIRGVARFAGRVTFSRPGRPLRLVGTGLYRGAMEVRPGSSGGVTAINSLPIDTYVQGVVAGEMPSSWSMEGLKAQAVAARTYALATRKPTGVFDVFPDTRSQVYRGVAGETSRTNSAVRRTANEVVTYAGEPIVTYYFSTSGGRTENVELSFLGATPQPYLTSVEDPYDDISPRHRWQLRFSTGRIAARLGSLVRGRFRRIEVARRGRSPRIVRARVVGTRGTRTATGPQLRARLGLYDTWARFITVTSSQAARSRARVLGAKLALPQLVGRFDPAPRDRLLLVERRAGRSWKRVIRVRSSRAGGYRATLLRRGVYRVRSGATAGPAVRIR
jgi:stage II sporulation protein D